MKLVSSNEEHTEYSVTEISNLLKRHIEDKFYKVRIKGEVSGLKIAPSGHVYLSLKDNDSVISAVMWKGVYAQQNLKIEDGLEIICTGNITIFSGQSKYQLIVESISLAGLGSLMLLLEKRKKQFLQEGLFDNSHKKSLPYLPSKIGVITSITGAVIRDIIHRLRERFPVHVVIWSVLVQGDKSAEEVKEAINGFNKMIDKPDLLIIARGGGSIEDLWGFNEEIVIRAAFASKIPIISAIGHETDTTLLDFVADKRAPTPTAAAEMSVPVRTELQATISSLHHRLQISFDNLYKRKLERLNLQIRSVPNLSMLVANKIQKLDELSLRLIQSRRIFIDIKNTNFMKISSMLRPPSAIIQKLTNSLKMNQIHFFNSFSKYIESRASILQQYSMLLDGLSYHNTLKRGYAIIRQNNKIITGKQNLKNETISIEFHDGEVLLNKK